MAEEQPPNPRAAHDDSLIQGKNWFTKRINEAIDVITPRCRENTRILSQGMDERLPLILRLRLRLHFVMCCYCKRYAEQLHYIRKAARGFPEFYGNTAAATLPVELKERIKAILRRESSER